MDVIYRECYIIRKVQFESCPWTERMRIFAYFLPFWNVLSNAVNLVSLSESSKTCSAKEFFNIRELNLDDNSVKRNHSLVI